MSFPILPVEGEALWYEKRAAWDAAVVADLEGRLGDTQLDARIDTAIVEVGSGGAGSGILTFPVGTDVSNLPIGTVFGFYVPSEEELVAPILKGSSTASSVSGTAITLDPAAPTSGVAAVTNDWVIVALAINAPDSNTFEIPTGWSAVREDYQLIGTMRTLILAHKRVAGDTSYTFNLPVGAAAKALNATAFWVSGAGDRPNWVVGPAKARTDAPPSSTVNRALPLTTVDEATLVLTLSFERTTAPETNEQVTVTGATKWLFTPAVSSAITTLVVAFEEVPTPGTTDAVDVTYPVAQATNGYAFQLGIPPAGV